MESKVSLWIPLIASIVAVTNAASAHAPAADITRTVSVDKGGRDNRDRQVTAHGEHGPGVRYDRQSYKDGSIASKYDTLESNLGGGDHRNGLNQGVKPTDDYSHDYNHDYHHSHGYRSYHHRSDDGKNGDDGYHGYYRVHFGHDDEGKDEGDRGVDQNDYKHADYHYNDKFEIHFGNSGKENDGQGYGEDSDRNGHGKLANKQALDGDYNEGVDDHGFDYHYAYTEDGSNHGKDYPNIGDDRHYRRHERDRDHWTYRYGVVHSDH